VLLSGISCTSFLRQHLMFRLSLDCLMAELLQVNGWQSAFVERCRQTGELENESDTVSKL
jgi:hypothetical protein